MQENDIESGVGGGGPVGGLASKLPPAPWWLDSYRSQIVTGLALLELLCGVITAISIFPSCIITGVLQTGAALVVLAVEAPTFVAFLSFAAPIGALFEGRPLWMKAAAYAVIAFVPTLAGCFGIFYVFGFLAGLAIAVAYFYAAIGMKASRDEMGFNAGGGDQGVPGQGGYSGYSPTSP